ncbi:MAG: methylation-associated defense system protein MAD4 [bacterium]
MKDLVVLAPDKNAKFGIDGLLSRYESLNIRQISYDIFVHPLHDPGVYRDAANFLRPLSSHYSYALVFLDHEGSGQEITPPDEIARRMKTDIERNGWPNRIEVIVFHPELEIWVWTESPHTAKALGWGDYSELKNWLIGQKIWQENASKPKRPKEAVEVSLRMKRIPRSSSIYKEISQNVSLDRCQDRSFRNFRDILQKWFPKGDK